VLQCFSALRCVVVKCIMVQHVAVCCSVLQCVVVCCSALHLGETEAGVVVGMLQHVIVLLQCVVACCSVF